MTDRAKQKEEVKKEIRSLLLSAPLGLTVVELKRDFLEFIGKPLPWKELGYSNVEEFVQDIPDTAQVTWGNTGMVLTAVSNKSTKHIQKLVQNQKVDSRVKRKVTERRARSFMNSGGNRGNFQPQGGYNTRFVWQRNQRNNHGQQRARHLAAPPSVPAYVRGQISQLVANHAEGLPLTHICAIFRNRFGTPLDFKGMGFSSENDLLSSLRDVVGMRTLAGGETRVMSIHHCVAWDQRRWNSSTAPVKNHSSALNPNSGSGLLPTPSLIGMPISQPVPAPKVGKGRGRAANRPDIPVVGAQSQTKQNSGTRAESSNVGNSKVSPARQLSSNTDSGRDSLELEHNSNIPTHVQDEIKQIMMKRPKGVCASRLPFEYKDMFKRCLSTTTYGYNSVIEFVSDLPHIIRIERPHPQGDWHLFPGPAVVIGSNIRASCASTQDKTTPAEGATTNSSSPPLLEVDQSLREAVVQVLGINPDGIPLDQFNKTFQAATGKPLDVDKYGPGGLKRVLHSMSDLLIISLDASDKAIVLPKMHSGPRRFNRLKDQFHPTSHSDDDKTEAVLHLPNDAVSPGCKYRPQPLPPPSEADGSNYIELYVSNVINPGTFWIQLRGRKTTLALEDLMDELEEVYGGKALSADYNMTPTLAQKGMACAVIFPEDSFWHRGCITGFKDQLYQVYFVDYGNTCFVSIDQMRLLKTKFLKLPAQAIQARLGHIRPIDGEWKSNSKTRLLALAREKPLVGLVVAEKDRVLSLCLTDTSKSEDIHFNDVFVDEGYAMFQPDNGVESSTTHLDQAPSSTFLYGSSTESLGVGADRTTYLGQQDTNSNNAQAEEVAVRYVRQAEMMQDVTLNLINLHGQLYLTSAQVSALFFDQDIISDKLRRLDMTEIPKVLVEQRHYTDLFKELLMYEAPDVKAATDSLTLFALSGLPLIIELFSKEGELEEIKATALEILEWFDPDDPFWKGEDDADLGELEEDDEDDRRTQSSADDTAPSLEELQLVLKSLEIKRKRILARMLSEATGPECVNELNTVELHIKRMESLISRLDVKPALVSSVEGSSQVHSSTLPPVAHTQPIQRTDNPPQTTTKTTPKTTHKVAPMVQQSPAVPAQSAGSSFKPIVPQAVTPQSMSGMDLTSLLQQQMAMSQMMMQQLGLPAHSLSMPGQSSLGGQAVVPGGLGAAASMTSSAQQRGFGRGFSAAASTQLQQQQQQQQFQQLMMQNKLMQGPDSINMAGLSPGGIGGNALQGSQLFTQQQQELQAINARLSALGMAGSQPAPLPHFPTANFPPVASMTASGLGTNTAQGSLSPGLFSLGRGQPIPPPGGPQQQSSLVYSALHQQQRRQQQYQ